MDTSTYIKPVTTVVVADTNRSRAKTHTSDLCSVEVKTQSVQLSSTGFSLTDKSN